MCGSAVDVFMDTMREVIQFESLPEVMSSEEIADLVEGAKWSDFNDALYDYALDCMVRNPETVREANRWATRFTKILKTHLPQLRGDEIKRLDEAIREEHLELVGA